MIRTKIIAISTAVIVLLAAMLGTTTYALFSDEEEVPNRLQAGTLELGLWRTSLTTETVEADGTLSVRTDDTETDLTQAASPLFDLNKIVPGLRQSATIKIVNKGTVAFSYTLDFVIQSGEGGENARKFAEQISIRVTRLSDSQIVADGVSLASFANGDAAIDLGIMSGKGQDGAEISESYALDVSFRNDVDNNGAKGGKVDFDIVIRAVQFLESK